MATAVQNPSLFTKSVHAVRTTRRAYIGAHVMAFEFAQKRAKLRAGQILSLRDVLIAKGETVEGGALELVDTAKTKVEKVLPRKVSAEIKIKPNTVKKTAKPSSKKRIKTDITVKTAKTEVKTEATAEVKAAQKGKIVTDKYAPFVEATQAYDADVNPVQIKKIVDHLGVALSTRDGKFVACSDEAERKTVATSWLLKKLGVEADAAALDAKVQAVCETMKADRFKNRVTFYYLLAKNEGKLGAL